MYLYMIYWTSIFSSTLLKALIEIYISLLSYVALRLFQWETFYKDNFLYFPLFVSIKKDELKENYFLSI